MYRVCTLYARHVRLFPSLLDDLPFLSLAVYILGLYVYVWISFSFVCAPYKYNGISLVKERRRFGRCYYTSTAAFLSSILVSVCVPFPSTLAELWIVQFCIIYQLRPMEYNG